MLTKTHKCVIFISAKHISVLLGNSEVVKILGSLPSKKISVVLVIANVKCKSCESWKSVQDISPLMDSNGKEPIT